MTDSNFPLTSAKIKSKYERLENKISTTADPTRKSIDKYLSEQALVNLVGVI